MSPVSSAKPADIDNHLSNRKTLHRHAQRRLAACLLLLASAIGIIYRLATPLVTHQQTPFFVLDIAAYAVLGILACLIYKNVPLAKLVYTVAAVVWFVALIFFLPERFGHSVDLYAIFMQLILVALGLVILYSR